MESTYIKYLKPAILLISVWSISQWLNISVGSTVFWWAIYFTILFCFYKLLPSKKEHRPKPIRYWLVLIAINLIYGISMAENYWDWKLLVSNTITFLMPLAALVFYTPNRLQPVLSFWLKYAFIIFLILAPYMESDAFGRFLTPFTFLALFFPTLSKKYKLMVLIAYAITIILGINNRSDILKFTICLILAFVANWQWFLSKATIVLKFLHALAFAIPFVFLILGFKGIFNVFQIQEELGLADEQYSVTDTNTGEEVSITNDTRTFIYIEEVESAIKHDYMIHGRSMARGYDSPFFALMIDEQLYGDYHPGERASSEVSILNIFNYFGLIGVVLYFLIFWNAARLAITDSNNIYVKVVGLYVSFRWISAFIEDFSRFDLNMLFLWIMIGICYSPYWRRMSDNEVKQWARSI